MAIRLLSKAPGILRSIWRNRSDALVMPRLLTYTVTFRCNAKCIMCDSWKIKGKDDLTLEEFESIVKQLPKMDFVRLTGGEPFVRGDLPEIARLVDSHLQPLALHITSNGFLTDRIVSFCETRKRSSPLQLLISLDGVEEKHNQIRGSSLAWKTAWETIQILAARQKELRLELSVNQTIVDAEGAEQYRTLREKLRPLGISHQVVFAYDKSATYSTERNLELAPKEIGQFTTFGKFTQPELEGLFRMLESDTQQLPWMNRIAKRYYLSGIKARLLPDEKSLSRNRLPNPRCVALHSHLRIFPNGDVPTCQFNSRIVGNLRNQRFEEIWHSTQTSEQRKWVRNCAGCWAECEVLPSAIYTGEILRLAR